ncbi:MAG: aminopeptidase P family protein [Acidimicrobiales bacterium]|nr:aminopeptidase P family protein [Acidimicrobiales bacterium]
MDVAGRLARLRERAADAGCDAVLVTSLLNVRWLTGFTGSAGLLLVRPDDALLVTDGRYAERAAAELAESGAEVRLVVARTQAAQRDEVVSVASGVRRVGLEAGAVTWAEQRSFAETWFPSAELVPTERLAEELRLVKDPGEVARIEAAAAIVDRALAAVRPLLVERPTERTFARALDDEILDLGADGTSFDTIVAGGPNASQPHARPGDRPIGPGEPVVVDVGARVDGYCSDMTRTLVVGEPTPTVRRLLEVVDAARAAGVAAVRAGVAGADVDRACRELIAEAGWGEQFVHGTGHGVGLEIHEHPRLGATSPDLLAAGHVVTVEPGVYLAGEAGVRIEDLLVVDPDGCRVLTRTPHGAVLA